MPSKISDGPNDALTVATGRALSDHERELLNIIVEEAAEMIQAASKILRFGAGDKSTLEGDDNLRSFGLDVGDLLYMVHAATCAGLLSGADVTEGWVRKSERLRKYAQHPRGDEE